MSMKRKAAILKKIIVALGVVFLGCATGFAQNTPSLSLAAGKVGVSNNNNGRSNNFEFYMDPSGYPRAVTAGETVFMFGSWPSSLTSTISDDKSNTWTAIASCTDSTSTSHGIYYAVNAAAGTSVLTQTLSATTGNTVLDWAHFYNMSTTASGFVDGNSCLTGVTPANNTPPNITGTPYTTATNGDLILTCVYIESSPLAKITGGANAITSITWPTGFTGLSEDATYGHACAYEVQATAGSFTPSFTIAQSSHSKFTIMSAAFKAGSGGSSPGNGASIALSEMFYLGSSGSTTTINLPCPTNSTAVAVSDDANSLTAVSDSGSSTWTHITAPGGNYGPIFYTNSPVISSSNSYSLTITVRASGNNDLMGLYCLVNTGGIDTNATAQNGSTLNGAGSGSTYNGATVSGGTALNAPAIGTSFPGDLVLDTGAMGFGPVDSCITGKCVFDYGGGNPWSSGGDNESYANGDLQAHFYAPTASTVTFNFNIGSGASSTTSGVSLAFKPASGGGNPPAPPTGLKATVK